MFYVVCISVIIMAACDVFDACYYITQGIKRWRRKAKLRRWWEWRRMIYGLLMLRLATSLAGMWVRQDIGLFWSKLRKGLETKTEQLSLALCLTKKERNKNVLGRVSDRRSRRNIACRTSGGEWEGRQWMSISRGIFFNIPTLKNEMEAKERKNERIYWRTWIW